MRDKGKTGLLEGKQNRGIFLTSTEPVVSLSEFPNDDLGHIDRCHRVVVFFRW